MPSDWAKYANAASIFYATQLSRTATLHCATPLPRTTKLNDTTKRVLANIFIYIALSNATLSPNPNELLCTVNAVKLRVTIGSEQLRSVLHSVIQFH